MGGLIGPAGTIKALTRQFEDARRRTNLSTRMQETINTHYTEENVFPEDDTYDLVIF